MVAAQATEGARQQPADQQQQQGQESNSNSNSNSGYVTFMLCVCVCLWRAQRLLSCVLGTQGKVQQNS